MYSITKVIIDRLIDFVENRHERSMALTENDAFDLCRQECRHILGNALYCNKEYVHAEICWETGSVLEYFVGIDDSKSNREEFPEYMDEENSPYYAYVLCDRKSGQIEQGPCCLRVRTGMSSVVRKKEGRRGKIKQKLEKLQKKGVETTICLENRKYHSVNVRNANGGLNAEKIDRFLKGFERGIEKGRVPMLGLASLADMKEEQLGLIYEEYKKTMQGTDFLRTDI